MIIQPLLYQGTAPVLITSPECALTDRVQGLILKNDFFALGALLAQQERATLKQIKQTFCEACAPLSRALTATENILQHDDTLWISAGKIAKLALFIETEFPQRIAQREYCTRIKRTIIEYDPATKKTLLYSENREDCKVGSGVLKVVSKAILYDVAAPEIVALGRTEVIVKREMKHIKALQGSRGISELYTMIKHQKTLLFVMKLYNCGSLKSVFQRNGSLFSMQEKMNIVLGALYGLKAMHDKGLTHNDLHAGNVLVNSVRENDERKVTAVITDFGRTLGRRDSQGSPQPGHRYRAPECYFYEDLESEGHQYTDIFALGCIFYQLFYERQPSWWTGGFFERKHESDVAIIQEQRAFTRAITQAIGPRKRALNRWCFLCSKKTQQELFEALILRMLDPTPSARGTATLLTQEMERILALPWSL